MLIRTGIGYDSHKLDYGLPLWLGGVMIQFEKGLVGHSDGDVLIHAIVDALLGAAGLGDIGTHFPSTNPAYQGVSSRIFLTTTCKKLWEFNWQVINVDATIIAEKPILAPFIPQMRDLIAQDMSIKPSQVNIKATTNDGMGLIGNNQGMAVYAIATLEQAP